MGGELTLGLAASVVVIWLAGPPFARHRHG